jgi:hypothetical protein
MLFKHMPVKISSVKHGVQRMVLLAIMIAIAVASISRARADIALVDTAAEAGLSMSIAETGPTSVTISNFTVSAMANVLVVLVEDKGASAVNSEPATLAWGSQTILKAIAQDNPSSTFRGESIYYLFNPTPGTNNITVSVANSPVNVEMTAYTLNGVDTTVAPKTGSGGNTASSVTFNVSGVAAGSWAAVNSTWSGQGPVPTITGTGGTNTMTTLLVVDSQSTVMTAGYISGLSGGADTFTATGSGSQKNNLAAAVFTPLTTAINITAASATPNPVAAGSTALLSVTASSTAGSITSVVVNANSIGGPSSLPLNLSAGNVYTNSVTTIMPSIGAILPITVQDNVGNTCAGSVRVVVETIADMQFDAFNKAYLIQNSNGQVYYAKSLSNSAPDGTWTFSIDIMGAEDAYERTHSPVQQQLVNNLCTTWLIQTPLPWNDGWNDDIGWFSLSLVRGYQMTGNTNFLNAAEWGFNYAFTRGWDTNYNNGGIWEEQPSDNNGVPNKNPLSNDSLMQTVCMLYQSTSNALYLAQAEQIYGWVRTNIFNQSTGQVYGDIATNGTVDTSKNLYNQGTFVDCANLLHNITGQQVYYNDASNAVEYAIKNLTSSGIFSDSASYLNTWAAEFGRGMGHFVKDNNLYGTFYPFMLANANAAWNCRRLDYNVSWSGWTQPTPTTNDMIANWAVNAVAMMWATPTGPATNFTLNYGGSAIVQPSGADWNSTNNWSPLGVGAMLSVFADPASTFEAKTGSRLRTPTTSAIFPGNQLILDGSGVFENDGSGNPTNVSELRFKNGDAAMTNYFNSLVLNGGQLDAGNNGIEIIQGNMNVASNSTIYVDNGATTQERGYRIDAQLSGSGNLLWHEYSGTLGGINLQITGTGNTFTGQWLVDQGALVGVGANSLGTNNIIVGTNGLTAAVETLYDLNNANASLVLGASGKMFLHQTNHFASVTINGTVLTNGIYPFAKLNSDYPANFPASWTQQAGSTFTTGSGQIVVGNFVVVPPPPQITSIGISGAQGLALSATNGTPGGSWELLQSTNVSLPLSQWQTNATGSFDGSGNMSTNIANAATNLQGFYILKVQ